MKVAQLLVFVLCVFLISTTGNAAQKTIRLVTGTDYAPYTDPNLPNGGVVTKIVSRVFEEMSYKVETQFYPWKRAYQRVLDLDSDATFPYAWDEERAALFYFSRPVNDINIRIFEYAGRAKNLRPIEEDLAGLTYCQPLGYLTEPELVSMIEQGKLSRFEGKDMHACFKVLGLGRVDFVIANDLVAWESAKAVFGEDAFDWIKPAKDPIRLSSEHVIISRFHPQGKQIIDQFNKTYDKLLATGEFDDIWLKAVGETVGPAR